VVVALDLLRLVLNQALVLLVEVVESLLGALPLLEEALPETLGVEGRAQSASS
jgi:hypothetical protein